MHRLVEIGTAILDDDHTIVGVRSVEHGAQYRTARRNSKHDERVDIVRAQQLIEIGSRKGTDAAFRHYEIVAARRETRIDGAAVALEEALVRCGSLHRAEKRVARAGFGHARTERDLDMDNPDARLPCRPQDLGC